MGRILNVADVPVTDRPVADRSLSGVKDFLGLYGGEHIAATEFVFGATMVTWGCSAKMILIGLIIGNILATLSFTFFCAFMGTKTRLTLYSFLKKILGKNVQKVYTLVWACCSIALAASGICVSGTAIKEVAGVAVQQHWYPTSIAFVAIVVILGIVVTIIAANGFEACAKFAGTCVPWMILVFFVGALVALPQLADATGVSIHSFADVWNIFDNNVGIKSGFAANSNFGVGHVILFAWLNNLAWHMGLNDMSLFRFAKNYKYGYVSAIGMFIGHFFAWTMAAVMGTAAAAVLNLSMSQLDPGLTTNTIFGLTGICAVVVAGWTTANPTVYRTALSLNSCFPKLTHKQSTYIVGMIMTVLACFPAMQNIPMIALILAWVTVGVGMMCMVEEFVFPKLGYTKYFSMYKEMKVNKAALITWIVSMAFAFISFGTGLLDRYYISIPEAIISIVLYIVLAGAMGAKEDYSREVAEEEKFQKELKEYVDKIADEELGAPSDEKGNQIVPKVLSAVAYVGLVAMFISAVMNFTGSMELATFKTVSFALTIGYFILNGTSTFIKFRREKRIVQ